MREGGDALGYRPDPVQPQAVDRHGARHEDVLNAVGLAVAVGVFPQRDVTHPVPEIFNDLALPYKV